MIRQDKARKVKQRLPSTKASWLFAGHPWATGSRGNIAIPLACSWSLLDTSVIGYRQRQGTAPQGPVVWARKSFLHFYINWRPMCQIRPIKHSCPDCPLFPEESKNSCSRSKCHPDGSATLSPNPAERWNVAAGGAALPTEPQVPTPSQQQPSGWQAPIPSPTPPGKQGPPQGFAQDRARRSIYCVWEGREWLWPEQYEQLPCERGWCIHPSFLQHGECVHLQPRLSCGGHRSIFSLTCPLKHVIIQNIDLKCSVPWFCSPVLP